MIISGGQILAIDKVKTDGTISGDGVFQPLGVISAEETSWSSISGEVPLVSSVDLSSLSSTESGSFVVGSALYDLATEINNKISSVSSETYQYITSAIKPTINEDGKGNYILCFGDK